MLWSSDLLLNEKFGQRITALFCFKAVAGPSAKRNTYSKQIGASTWCYKRMWKNEECISESEAWQVRWTTRFENKSSLLFPDKAFHWC